MKIYTKTGDSGTTGLVGGSRVSKSDLLMEAMGTVDELNASLGKVFDSSPLADMVGQIQNRLFDLGAELATPEGTRFDNSFIESKHIADLETSIDSMEPELEPLRNFILPGGSMEAADLHLSRTICRRAERRVVELADTQKIRQELLTYLNRLSDWLFVAARFSNHFSNVPDILWEPTKK